MPNFIRDVLLPILKQKAGIIDEESTLIDKEYYLRTHEDHYSGVKDDGEDTYWEDWNRETEESSKWNNEDKLMETCQENGSSKSFGIEKGDENSVDKLIENNVEASREVMLREKALKKPVADTTLMNDWKREIIASETGEGNGKRKSRELSKSAGSSGEGSSSVNNKNKSPNRKIQKQVDNGPEAPPPLPREFKNAILALAQGRPISQEKLVIQKRLFSTDLDKFQNRLSIPVNQMREEFLTEEEKRDLSKRVNGGKRMACMTVNIIGPLLGLGNVELRRWEMKKDSGNSSLVYVVNKTWGKICEDNQLSAGDIVQLWAVRVDEELWFLLVKLP